MTVHKAFRIRFSASSKKAADKSDVESAKKAKEVRLYRQGKEYHTMRAGQFVCHECDITKLPEGFLIIKRMRRYSYEQVSSIISICKMQGVLVLQYLKEFFKQIVFGCDDYKNLLLITLEIINNKQKTIQLLT